MLDKWMHGITFAALAIWFSGQYARRSYGWLAIGLLIFGALIEACQSMVTYRTAETADLVADLLGIVAGMMIALTGVGGWSLQVENWLQRGRTR
jgi:VanZ family protein